MHNQVALGKDNINPATAGHLFNATINPNLNFTLNTTIPNKHYQSAGIKSLNPNVSLLNPGNSQCTPSANGYCLFGVSDAIPALFSFSAPAGNANFKACLNATGKTYSCENMNIEVQYAYVADFNGFVWKCPLSQDGSFGTCETTPIPNTTWVQGPYKITFATVGGTQLAYVAEGGGGGSNLGDVYQCGLTNNNDSFSACSVIPNQGWSTYQVAFTIVGSIQFAYIADGGTIGKVWQCPLNNNGSFGTCSTLTPAFTLNTSWTGPSGITFAVVGGTKYAYVSDGAPLGTGNVYRCTINTDGSFNTCSFTDQNNWDPFETVFATVGGTQYAYVVDVYNDGRIWQCPLNNTDGTFGTCFYNTQTYTYPKGLAFTTVAGTQYAYVADGNGFSQSNLYQCTLNPDGSFNICSSTLNTNPTWSPYGVTVLSR